MKELLTDIWEAPAHEMLNVIGTILGVYLAGTIIGIITIWGLWKSRK